MKKRITVLTTVILCAVSLVAGAAAGVVISNEIRDELGPNYSIRDGQKGILKEPDTIKTSEVNTPSDATENNNPSTPDASSFIGEERAKEIALSKAGISADSVIFDRVELDRDDGIWQYEIEFRKGFTEYDADINATDGSIRSWDVDQDD